jgi:transposase
MSRYKQFLKDGQWSKIEKYFPKIKASRLGGPKPKNNRQCFEGILWVLKTGARWRDLPEELPSGSTCWRRLQLWESSGVLEKIWKALLKEMDKKQLLDWSNVFSDGSFSPAKKGVLRLEKPRKAREPSGWWWLMAKVFLWESNWLVRVKQKST